MEPSVISEKGGKEQDILQLKETLQEQIERLEVSHVMRGRGMWKEASVKKVRVINRVKALEKYVYIKCTTWLEFRHLVTKLLKWSRFVAVDAVWQYRLAYKQVNL